MVLPENFLVGNPIRFNRNFFFGQIAGDIPGLRMVNHVVELVGYLLVARITWGSLG